MFFFIISVDEEVGEGTEGINYYMPGQDVAQDDQRQYPNNRYNKYLVHSRCSSNESSLKSGPLILNGNPKHHRNIKSIFLPCKYRERTMSGKFFSPEIFFISLLLFKTIVYNIYFVPSGVHYINESFYLLLTCTKQQLVHVFCGAQ